MAIPPEGNATKNRDPPPVVQQGGQSANERGVSDRNFEKLRDECRRFKDIWAGLPPSTESTMEKNCILKCLFQQDRHDTVEDDLNPLTGILDGHTDKRGNVNGRAIAGALRDHLTGLPSERFSTFQQGILWKFTPDFIVRLPDRKNDQQREVCINVVSLSSSFTSSTLSAAIDRLLDSAEACLYAGKFFVNIFIIDSDKSPTGNEKCDNYMNIYLPVTIVINTKGKLLVGR